MIRQESASQALVHHNQPDYENAPIDHATSQFSPVPKRVMDGSEEGDVLPAAVLSGAPVELEGRTVRIYRPAKTATQSGDWHGHHWRMDWDPLGKGDRWENFLMGWQSSGDFMQGTHLNFKNKDDAIRFAEKQGYEYFVQEPNDRKFVPKAYANNFVHSGSRLKTIPTK
ncbi:MAG: NADH:ubiquinone oxidoreductase 21kD subunit [Piccolia ochrophora]|nr:MAG: NADH:ubiquinone oxidoreductase 21kD subunit [Piccolia ochrophora]